jgi:hypothetical protein
LIRQGDLNNNQIASETGVCRNTVSKYRNEYRRYLRETGATQPARDNVWKLVEFTPDEARVIDLLGRYSVGGSEMHIRYSAVKQAADLLADFGTEPTVFPLVTAEIVDLAKSLAAQLDAKLDLLDGRLFGVK